MGTIPSVYYKINNCKKQRWEIQCQATYTYTIENTQYHGWLKSSQIDWAKHWPETLSLINKILRGPTLWDT